MPEGDSIYRVAARLRPRLAGEVLVDARVRGDTLLRELVGQTVQAVESRGKHLLVRPATGPTLRVHLGMRGNWRRFEPGSRWRRARHEASLILATQHDVFACFRATVDVLHEQRPDWTRGLSSLGPDLLADSPALDRVVARAVLSPQRPLHDVLLDQRVAAGIGNVYKNEVLFLAGLHPSTPVRALEPAALRSLYERAIRLLRANLGPGWRVTRGVEPGEAAHRPGESRYYVYRRAGRPCFRCATTVRLSRHGEQARATYHCPVCQAAPLDARP